MTWEDLCKSKREKFIAQIPTDWALKDIPSPEEEPNISDYLEIILPVEKREISNSTISKLASWIANGKLSCYQVAKVFFADMLRYFTN